VTQDNDDVPRHEQNGSRNYLADEVSAQRQELTNLGKEIAGANATIAMLLEADKRASMSRHELHRELSNVKQEVGALRSEQQQIMQSSVATQSGITDIKKMLAEHETERQQQKGAWKLATASARIAWTLLGIVGTAALGLFAWVMKFGSAPIPPAPPHP
jgi:hypothetical protein